MRIESFVWYQVFPAKKWRNTPCMFLLVSRCFYMYLDVFRKIISHLQHLVKMQGLSTYGQHGMQKNGFPSMDGSFADSLTSASWRKQNLKMNGTYSKLGNHLRFHGVIISLNHEQIWWLYLLLFTISKRKILRDRVLRCFYWKNIVSKLNHLQAGDQRSTHSRYPYEAKNFLDLYEATVMTWIDGCICWMYLTDVTDGCGSQVPVIGLRHFLVKNSDIQPFLSIKDTVDGINPAHWILDVSQKDRVGFGIFLAHDFPCFSSIYTI